MALSNRARRSLMARRLRRRRRRYPAINACHVNFKTSELRFMKYSVVIEFKGNFGISSMIWWVNNFSVTS
ncbi:hypothetical protein T02_10434 [Trichinella nativa]|uniref:Uncharacterized protein n=1 Tax=Trichinella nativa TaxID=6335 RepID=A0A0V1KRH2_9BILA|nr:hypothetical protein T02_10434 [Trichinella nativa]